LDLRGIGTSKYLKGIQLRWSENTYGET